MTAQRGKDLLIKIGDGGSPEVFTTVAGLRATTLAFNAQTVDTTNAHSTDAWRELLAGGGVKSATLSGSGVFKDAASLHDAGCNGVNLIAICHAAVAESDH